MVEEVDDGLGLLTEHDPADDPHVRPPVRLRLVRLALLYQRGQPLL